MGQICSFLWTRKIQKAFSFRGLRPTPLTPHRGVYPLDHRWGLRPQTPVTRSRSVLAMASEPYQGPPLTKAGSGDGTTAGVPTPQPTSLRG